VDTPIPAVDWPTLPTPEGTAIAKTDGFVVYAMPPGDPFLVDVARHWSGEIETLSARLARRLAARPPSGVTVVFQRSYQARCRARGLATTGPRRAIIVYVADGTAHEQIRAVLAHEIVHQISAQLDFVGDGVLTEGLANWIARPEVLAWQRLVSFDQAVRSYIADGQYVVLSEERGLSPQPGEDCLERRDRVYNERASFVGWLIRRYGLHTVTRMPVLEIEAQSGDGAVVRAPDYESATGHNLVELEQMWLEDVLRRQQDTTPRTPGRL
jgi:hypothetical protein